MQLNLVPAQNSPDLIVADVTQCCRQQTTVPLAVAIRSYLDPVMQGLAFLRSCRKIFGLPDIRRILKPGETMATEPLPPLRNTRQTRVESARDPGARQSLCSQQNNIDRFDQPMLA